MTSSDNESTMTPSQTSYSYGARQMSGLCANLPLDPWLTAPIVNSGHQSQGHSLSEIDLLLPTIESTNSQLNFDPFKRS